ncbi:MAG TPA: EAL domain-containing protein [Anaerolineales bacterium]|nr:EAL domain-containing protein [Anaerolineales bacterium]
MKRILVAPIKRLRQLWAARRLLRYRLIISLGALLLVSQTLLGISAIYSVNRMEAFSWRGRQFEASENAADTVAAFLGRIDDILALASLPDRATFSRQPELLQGMLEQNPALLEVVRLDSAGQVVASASRDRPLLANLFTIPQSQWFLQARQGQIYRGNVQFSANDEPYLILARPAAEGGVAAARVHMQVLWEVVSDIHFGKTGQAYVLTREGIIIAHTRQEHTQEFLDLGAVPAIAGLLQTPGTGMAQAYTNLQGVRVVGVATPVPETSWVVVAEMEQAEAFAASRLVLRILALIVAAYFLVLTHAAQAFLRRMFLDPLERLQVGAERIGQGDLSHRISLKSGDEISQVSQAFDEMTQRLDERERQVAEHTAALTREVTERLQAQEALSRLNAELEERVRRRTAELLEANAKLERDIADRRAAEEALRVSEARYALAVSGANDGIWDWDLRSGRMYFSSRWKAMLGYGEDEIAETPEEWFNLLHSEDLSRLKTDLEAHLEGLTPHLESEYRMLHRDGVYRWMLYRGLAVRANGGSPTRMAGSQTDITERKAVEQQLMHQALFDELTSLPNRTLFMDRLGRVIDRAKRHPDYLAAVIFLDIDRFKIINDSLGRASGDELLVSIARRLENCLRPGDTVSRFGSDEFAVLLEDIAQVSDATRVADRIQKELARSFKINDRRVFTSASQGIALTSGDHQISEDLLRDADTALHRAKSKGKARHEIFNAQMHAHALSLLQLEGDLRQAIDRREFCLHYQPIVSLHSGAIQAVEALIRWQHPQRGLLYPGEFISLAEETGLIVPIGEWVLQEACAQVSAWHAAGNPDLRVSVNISARQFQDGCLPKQVKSSLQKSGLQPCALELEITEQAAMQDIDLATRTLQELRATGIQVSIDDFGNGYSALGYLKHFPVDMLKIDRSFVSDVTHNPGDAAITTAIIVMGHALNLQVIAEGVETEGQLEFLQSQQCDMVQGFLLSRPIPPGQMEALLGRSSSLLPG